MAAMGGFATTGGTALTSTDIFDLNYNVTATGTADILLFPGEPPQFKVNPGKLEKFPEGRFFEGKFYETKKEYLKAYNALESQYRIFDLISIHNRVRKHPQNTHKTPAS